MRGNAYIGKFSVGLKCGWTSSVLLLAKRGPLKTSLPRKRRKETVCLASSHLATTQSRKSNLRKIILA